MKKLFIYATCQGATMSRLLKQSEKFCNDYQVEYFQNYSAPGQVSCDIADNYLAECSILLYHPINSSCGFSTDSLLTKLPDYAISHVLPYVTFSSYWPEFGKVANCPLGKTKDRPYGLMPYRIQFVDEMISNGIPKEKILDEVMSLGETYFLPLVEKSLRSDISYLERLDSVSGPMKISEYIVNNYKDRQLFYIFNHPKSEIYGHMANQLLNSLGYPSLSSDIIGGFASHQEQTMPIHPVVAELLDLKFCGKNHKYRYLGEDYSYAEFIRGYIDLATP
ncbi:MAG: WcbI family polysaccharide biosynthesis putative acetyltransferase [Rhodocyclaceae bacterium]|nr:WcbI family polysaccharide biosynthesis putative acetyltransferase [Rhodocyclaceae bacterium]